MLNEKCMESEHLFLWIICVIQLINISVLTGSRINIKCKWILLFNKSHHKIKK